MIWILVGLTVLFLLYALTKKKQPAPQQTTPTNTNYRSPYKVVEPEPASSYAPPAPPRPRTVRNDAPKIPWLEAELAEEPEPIDLSFMAPAQSQPRVPRSRAPQVPSEPIDLSFMAPAQSQPRAVRNEAPKKVSWLEAELAEEPDPEPVDTGTRSFGFFRSPAPTKVTKGPKAAWVPAGKSVTVAGIEISGGMIYFGRNLTGGQRDYRTEPALIDPSLSVNIKKARFDDTKLGYWPSYEGLEPADRAGYLQWLRDGRSDLGAPIGFVFLFFYGLERRALIDAPRNKEELRQIYAEVERLLCHYSGNSSFRSYASDFLAFLRLKLATRKLYEESPGTYPLTYEVPAEIRVALSQLTHDQKPMSGDWALSWLMNNREDVRLRTPAQRCEEEFKTLFVMRYQKKYGEGLLLKPSKKRLSISYRAASAGLGQIEASLGDLMDVTSLKRPINQLQAIADTCMDDLDAYSRFVGRRPGDAKSLEALALLPSELVASAETPEMVTFRHWVNEKLAQSELSVVGGKELLSQWPSSDSDRLSKSEAVALAQMLETLGVGIEPDVRFAGTPISAHGHAVLFRITGARSEAPSAEYKSCTLLMHLAAVVAGADGTVTDSEKEHLEEQMESTMQLAAHERRRLRAHLAWLLAEQPTATGLKTKLQKLPAGTRHQIAQFAVAIAGADGRIDPAEVKVLGKVYSALGIDASTVYADINSMAGGPPTAPVTVQVGTASVAGFKIPAPSNAVSVAPSKGQSESFQLDAKKVQERLKSTREVSSLLADIFTEPTEPERSASKAEAVATSNESVAAKMARLLRELENKSTLTRGEFEDIVGRFALMPAGAIDLLNETALESHDAPLLDGEDPILVDQDVLREMINAST